MTTPPNHNTADQSGAMQPTSSASSADEFNAALADIEACIHHFTDVPSILADTMARGKAHRAIAYLRLAIVPQVVQAPIEPKRHELNERNWRLALAFAPVPVLYVDEINGDQTCRDDLWLATTSQLAAPIVATGDLSTTVPSEAIAKAWYATGQDIRGGSLQSFMDALNSAPSPTEQASDPYFKKYIATSLEVDRLRALAEQASDVRNAALEEAALIVDAEEDNAREEHYYPGVVQGYEECAAAIRALKSAPAAKGNAQDEAANTKGDK